MAGLQAVIGESVQDLIVPGKCKDMYYSGVSNTTKECFPSSVNNKFVIDFSAKSGGSSSTFLFNPYEGVTDIVVELQLPDLSGVSPLPCFSRGWGLMA